MHTRLLRLVAIVLCLVAASALHAQDNRDAIAIRQLYLNWPRAVEAGDISRYVSFLDDSITLLIPGAPPIHGTDAYRTALGPLFKDATFRVHLTPPRLLHVFGPWAFAHYAGVLVTYPKNGGDSSVARNRYVDILRRQRDGTTWRLYLHSWQAGAAPSP